MDTFDEVVELLKHICNELYKNDFGNEAVVIHDAINSYLSEKAEYLEDELRTEQMRHLKVSPTK